MFLEMVRSSNYYELYIEYQEKVKHARAFNPIKSWQKFVPKGYNCPVCMFGMFANIVRLFKI